MKFLLNETYSGQYGKYGFEEILLKRYPNGAPQEKVDKKNPFKNVAEQVAKAGVIGPKSPLEKLREMVSNAAPPGFLIEMIDALAAFDPQIADILSRDKPDVFILDHFFVPPAIQRSPIPMLYLSSGNPLALYESDKLPPMGSGKQKYIILIQPL